jgi:predicted P-loop ATPase
MAIVLISTQGTGKTSTIKSMVPTPDEYVELSLSERDSDLCRAMRGKLIGELAELRGIASREMEAVKAWVSCRHDSWTPKYKEFAHTLPRRIILVGTSNQEEFLADETGNRRWLPIHVGLKQDLDRLIADRDQLWAEAHTLFDEHGILWRDAERLARAEHYKFEVHDPWCDTISEWLNQPADLNFAPLAKGYLTVAEVLRDCFMMDPSRRSPREMQRIGKVLVALGYHKRNKRVGGKQVKVWVNEDLENFI